MKHYLMRHPAIATTGRCIGQSDLPLSEEGKASVNDLVQVVHGVAPDLLISSDLRRCRELAEAAALRLECPIRLDARWREIDFGVWENRSWDEIRQADEAGFDRWSLDFQQESPPGGESFQDLLKRVAAAVEDLPRDQTAMVITHAGCLRAVACLLKITSPERMFDWQVPYGALFELDLDERLLVRQVSDVKIQPAFAR
jgi:alpha-ribazole phosphatase